MKTPIISRQRSWLSGRRILPALILVGLALIFLLPILWMFSQSLMTYQETVQYPLTLWPHVLQWGNYLLALQDAPLILYFGNTLLITVAVVVGATLTAAICAYGFARLRFPGRDLLFGIVLATLMLPMAVTLIPLYIIFRELHWINTFLPLTVPAFFGGGAFNIFLLRQFFRGIPRELNEAAVIDGANHWQIFWRVVLPLSRPALAVVAVTTAVTTWNDYLGPLIYLNTPDHFTLALGLTAFAGQAGLVSQPQAQLLMAATAMMVAPIIIVFIFAQRYLIQGIVTTGLKG
ncbi:MAG TPA: carbohydrate ABC transporter permease [Ktedonobacteraceae bacterium]|nr:carbohydrate ABC transporter permease [Ktedonobacteraceae bacterium]